jgi:hypothetical protein
LFLAGAARAIAATTRAASLYHLIEAKRLDDCRDQYPLTRRHREGSRLTLRTNHSTISGGRVVVVRSLPDTSC